MILRFYAREDLLATVPGAPIALGQHIPRVGRKFLPGGIMPATKEAHEVDTSQVSQAIVEQFKSLARHDDVWCSDEATAAACGVPFVPVKFTDGVWVKAPPSLKESTK